MAQHPRVNRIKSYDIMLLRIASYLIGEDFQTLRSFDPNSQSKVKTLFLLTLIPVAFGAISAFAIAGLADCGIFGQLAAAIGTGVLVFLIDRSVVNSASNPSRLAYRIRFVMSVASAFMCAVTVDTIIFHDDLAPIVAELRQEQVDLAVAAKTQEEDQRIASATTDYAAAALLAGQAQASFVSETDGSGGSGSHGFGPIAKQKKQIAEMAGTHAALAKIHLKEVRAQRDSRVESINADYKQAGMLLHINAMAQFLKANFWALFYWCTLFVFALFAEIMFMLNKSSHDKTAYELFLVENSLQFIASTKRDAALREAREARIAESSPQGRLVAERYHMLN
jgi:hypothetical protein